MNDLLAIAAEAEADDGAAPLDEAMVLTLRHRPESVRSWVEPDGFALLVGTEVSVVVRPSARRRGVGSRLLKALLAEATDPLAGWSHGNQPAAAALAASHGFRAARELWVMRRPSTDPLPSLPPALDGVELRGFRPEDPRDAEELLRVNAAAFAHHPEQGSLSRAGLEERMAESWFEPEGLIEAWSGDTLLGFHWTKRHSPELGEVYVVGIDPSAQGRGLGKLLTLAGLRHLADVAQVHLYVEADNEPAVRLYSGLGFTHEASDTHVQYRRAGAK